jgi:hypothetical protein
MIIQKQEDFNAEREKENFYSAVLRALRVKILGLLSFPA